MFAALPESASAAASQTSVGASVQLQSAEAQLQATLSGIPGIDASQVNALIADLNSLASGGTAPTLGPDLDAVLTALGNSSGVPAVQSVLGTLGGLVDGTPGVGQIESAIEQLEGLANSSGVPSSVGQAAAQIASGLTSADLAALLGQAGSPLGSSTIQGVLGDLGALGSLPTGSSVPSGDLSSIGQALDQIAAQPGVPAAVASVLEGLAGQLDTGNPVAPGTLGDVATTLNDVASELGSVPGVGSALSSTTGALGTELAASPPATDTGGSPYTASIQFVTAPATEATGATIHSFKYAHAKAVAVIDCPAGFTGGSCHSTLYVQVQHGRLVHAKVTVKAGKAKTLRVALPKTATIARKRSRKLVLDATLVTGTYATSASASARIK
jgi:hypothetical protein